MADKKYKVRMRFIFEGDFTVTAANSQEARENVEKHCGLVIGGDIHSSLPEEDIDWDFPTHPEKRILKVSR